MSVQISRQGPFKAQKPVCGSGPPQAESKAEFADGFDGMRIAIGVPSLVAAPRRAISPVQPTSWDHDGDRAALAARPADPVYLMLAWYS